MKTHPSRKTGKTGSGWPRKVTVGRVTVTVYKRRTPQGGDNFMVANYASGQRRFDSYASEALALEAADRLARQMSERDVLTASMTREQSVDYASAVQTLKAHNVTLPAAIAALAEALKLAGDLPGVVDAVRFYAQRHKQTTAKPVADVVAELLKIKEARGASRRYLQDLRSRLERFARDCRKDSAHVSTADAQAWLDGLRLSPQSYRNFRTVLHVLFAFAVARGYASDNPLEGAERVKLNGRDVQVFTPDEIARLLKAASPEFAPCLALGAFAGLRSAELERLEWSDIHLTERHIVVGAKASKTASRRIVPIADNLALWLAPYAKHKGKVWTGGHDSLYDAQQTTAKAAGVPWKQNALRHSFASYSFALTNDAGRIAGFLGNSAAVVHRHYRELVTPAAAQAWFAVAPLRALPNTTNT